METIASFTVDHLTLEPGIYVSRVDRDPATGQRQPPSTSVLPRPTASRL